MARHARRRGHARHAMPCVCMQGSAPLRCSPTHHCACLRRAQQVPARGQALARALPARVPALDHLVHVQVRAPGHACTRSTAGGGGKEGRRG